MKNDVLNTLSSQLKVNPYKVPEGKVFVLGDKRMASIDSRHKAMGCIDTDNIIGKLFFVIWPFEDIGIIK